MSKPEITWSLMHPTPLDVEYMRVAAEQAHRYRVDSFEICAACHSALGGLDGLSDCSDFPTAHGRIDLAGVKETRRKLRAILDIAHGIGKPVYYWHREAVVPDGLLEDLPELLDADGEFDLLGSAYERLLRAKIDSAFRAVPELDGIVLTLTEASYSVIHNSDVEKFPPRKVVEHLARIFASELRARGKRFILRSFGSIAQDYEDILAGAAGATAEYGFEIETKITPYDFDPFLPSNPFLRKLPGATLGAECDGLGEFLGAGFLPAENVENIVGYVRAGRAAGVDRYAIRIDRIGNRIFDRCGINLYAYERAIDDPGVTAEEIRREYLEKTAPASARATFARLGTDGLELVKKTQFIFGNVIFHQFPSRATTKFLKAGFIFALFEEGVDLGNGRDVWSILSDARTPGRAAILREKDEACAIADRALSLLDALPQEPGYEEEYRVRRELWENARVAAYALRRFCRAVAVYFDRMEAGDADADALKRAVADGREELDRIAGYDLGAAPPDGGAAHRMDRVYLRPLHAILGVLLEEYRMEYAMRAKYGAGAADLVVCGGITDEWRIRRYMHGGHAGDSGGELYRCAGNPVFPNGFLEMELARPAGGGTLEIFGDTAETESFRIAVDGSAPRTAKFDASGKAAFPIPAGSAAVKLRLTKAPGAGYPRFRAVVTRK